MPPLVPRRRHGEEEYSPARRRHQAPHHAAAARARDDQSFWPARPFPQGRRPSPTSPSRRAT
eukprot:8162529-Prorocentrum_lima.AAC.1